MLVKILDADPAFVEQLKVSTGMATASKAYSRAAEMFGSLTEHAYDQTMEVGRLNRKVEELEQIILASRSAAKVLLDHVSQTSLEL